jgi:chorismate mutase
MPTEGRSAQSLAQLRREIESVDRSLVLLLAARLGAAQRALRVRAAQRRGLTDLAQERRVLQRSRQWARELGVSETLVEKLFRTLIEEGKARFRATGTPPELSVVTVLLPGPEAAEAELRGAPEPQLVAVPTLR